LAVELMERSAGYDREVKVPRYARYGIPETWLMDLEQGLIEVYRNPTAQGYVVVRRLQWGQSLSPQAFPELDLAVDVILG
jgi:Uma2 family endonuclease